MLWATEMKLSNLSDKKIYISGKMSGLSVMKILSTFNKVEKVLCKKNAVMNHAILWHLRNISDFSYDEYMEIDFTMLKLCDTVIVLPGYETSKGAKKEINYAQAYGKEIFYLDKKGSICKEKYV